MTQSCAVSLVVVPHSTCEAVCSPGEIHFTFTLLQPAREDSQAPGIDALQERQQEPEISRLQ